MQESGPGNSFPRPMRLWESSGDGETEERDLNMEPSEPVPRMNLQSFLKSRRK
jgi:hypothetical protein